MLLIEAFYSGPAVSPDAQLELPFELRQKCRLRTRLKDGEEVGLFLERGRVLRGGDLLQAKDGRVVQVVSKPEVVLDVLCDDTLTLTRAAYHLGNRHVQLQVGAGWLRLLDDYVLRDMLEQIGGLTLVQKTDVFEPEAGAYGGGHHHGEDSSPAKIHEFAA